MSFWNKRVREDKFWTLPIKKWWCFLVRNSNNGVFFKETQKPRGLYGLSFIFLVFFNILWFWEVRKFHTFCNFWDFCQNLFSWKHKWGSHTYQCYLLLNPLLLLKNLPPLLRNLKIFLHDFIHIHICQITSPSKVQTSWEGELSVVNRTDIYLVQYQESRRKTVYFFLSTIAFFNAF